jgi:hypothetical protein
LVLVLDVTQSSENFSNTVMNELSDQLALNRKINIVDRQNLSAIRTELNLQVSGDVDDNSALSIGRYLGARYIVSGTLEDRQTVYRLRLRIISIETTQILLPIILDLKKDSQVSYLMGIDMPISKMPVSNLPIANIRNNWASVDVSGGYNIARGPGLSFGARYARMFGSKISLGANFFWFIPVAPELGAFEYASATSGFGIDASFRFYPTGRYFFIGFALGYHDYALADEFYSVAGFAITTVDLGWKIDVGKEGGFFLQPGLLATIMFPKERGEIWPTGYMRLYLGAGWAF